MKRSPLTACRRFALEAELRREGMPEAEARKILGELEKRESDYMRLQRTRMTSDDFEPLTIIGRGAFGEVGCTFGAPVSPFDLPPQF